MGTLTPIKRGNYSGNPALRRSPRIWRDVVVEVARGDPWDWKRVCVDRIEACAQMRLALQRRL